MRRTLDKARIHPRFIWLAFLLPALIFGLSACGPAESTSSGLSLAPESTLPDFPDGAPVQVREAYRFAIANPDLLRQFPCYCGCGSMRHMDNLDCYVKEFGADGSIIFENHAFG